MLKDFRETEIRMRGGMSLPSADYEAFPTHPLDLFNVMPAPDGYVSAPGWAIKGTEISSATNGKVNHITSFPTTTESNFTVAVCGKKAMQFTAGDWAAIQDGNNFTMTDNDHADSTIYNDTLVIASPKTGTADAIRSWAGTGNIAVLGGSPRNASWVQWLGDRLLTGGTFSGAGVYDATKIYRSAQLSLTSHPGDYTDMVATPDVVMRILRLGQMLIVYKSHSIAVLHITGDDLLPFEPDEIPGNVGLALSRAVAHGGRFHCFMSPDNFYLFDGLGAPTPIGDAIAPLVMDKLGSTSYMLAGYDNRSPQREAFWFLTNVALAADDVGPNSVASTNGYWVYDITTKSWARGDLGSNVPRAIGQYLTRFGFRDDMPLSLAALLLGIESSGGTSIYEMDYATANRIGASFTRRILSPVFHCGDPLRHKTVGDLILVGKKKSSGTFTISWKTSQNMMGKPTERKSISFDMTGTAVHVPIALSALYHQYEITATAAFELNRQIVRWRPR